VSVVHAGTSKKYASGWESIFGGSTGKKSSAKKSAKAVKKSSAKKAAPAKKKAKKKR
jgi:hypothetical protein